jgi:hypothetical protein
MVYTGDMAPGTKIKFKPETWTRYQRELGIDGSQPEDGVTIIHIAGERTTLRGYVWLGLPYAWCRIDELV